MAMATARFMETWAHSVDVHDALGVASPRTDRVRPLRRQLVIIEAALVVAVVGAVLGGAVFGDQCSPISDTTILSALACGGDVMDHVTTQLPLALAAAGMAATVYTVLAALV